MAAREMVTILSIDDRPEDLGLETALRPPDYRLIKGMTEKETFARLAAGEVAVILLALRPPDLKGFETARRIKEKVRFRKVPMIFLAAAPLDPEQTFKAYSVGAVDILLPPFDPGLVKAKISALADLCRAGREPAERTSENRYAAQQEITRLLAEGDTLKETAPALLRTVCERFGWEMGALWMTHRSAEQLRCAATWHLPSVEMAGFREVCRTIAFSRNEGLPGRIWAGEAPAWIPDVVEDANFPREPVAAREGLHAAFGFPVRGGEEVLGVLEFFSREVREPDEELLTFMAGIGTQIGQSIERCRLGKALRDRTRALHLALESARARLWMWKIPEDHFCFIFPSPSGDAAREPLGSIGAFLNRVERDDAQAVREAFGGALAGEKIFEAQFRLKERDGSASWYVGRGRIIRNAEGRPVRMIGVNVEVTEQKRLEEAVEQARTDLERAGRLASDLLFTLSDRLRTPVSGVFGYSNLLLDGAFGEIDPKQKIPLENVARNAAHLFHAVKEILGTSKAGGEKRPADREIIYLPALLREVVDQVKPLIGRKPLVIYWHTLPDLPLIESDPAGIKEILIALLSNAIRRTPQGTLRLIEKDVRERKGIEIAVEDTGIGLSPEMMQKITALFHGTDAGGTPGDPAVGQELRRVKETIDALQGEIRTENRPGEGTTFTLFLPYARKD